MFLKLQNQGQKSQVLQTYVLAGHVMSPAVYGTGSKGQQVMFVLCVLRVGGGVFEMGQHILCILQAV